MLNLHQKSANVNRLVLLEKLRENLKQHEAEYLDAIADYRLALILNLKQALVKAESSTPEDARKITVQFNVPPDYRKNYIETIELMEYSTDENINLDQDSFKAYIKNEWSWTGGFRALAAANKSYVESAAIGGAAGAF